MTQDFRITVTMRNSTLSVGEIDRLFFGRDDGGGLRKIVFWLSPKEGDSVEVEVLNPVKEAA